MWAGSTKYVSRCKYQSTVLYVKLQMSAVSTVDNSHVTCGTRMYRLNPEWVQETVRKFWRQKVFCLYRDSSPRPHSQQLSRYTVYGASALTKPWTLWKQNPTCFPPGYEWSMSQTQRESYWNTAMDGILMLSFYTWCLVQRVTCRRTRPFGASSLMVMWFTSPTPSETIS